EPSPARNERSVLSCLPALFLLATWDPALKRWAIVMFAFGRRKVERLDFIVAGAQKSGTTALHHFLEKHPQIELPDRQEMHFFDDEEIFSRPVDYEALHRHFRPPAWSLRLGKLGLAGEVT